MQRKELLFYAKLFFLLLIATALLAPRTARGETIDRNNCDLALESCIAYSQSLERVIEEQDKLIKLQEKQLKQSQTAAAPFLPGWAWGLIGVVAGTLVGGIAK